jgi:hypothetical protein
MAKTQSIFARYYAHEPFVDRYESNGDGAVDVVIPVLHSNELWKSNLISIYREVPVHRLLLGDGGCSDDTLVIARQFPRVTIYDHSAYKSLGYSVKELIKAVESEWFLYFHSDVYLPSGWFDTMRAHQSEYDWFGCPMRITALLEYPLVDPVRPYAGTQMGRKAAFSGGLDRIDDDYVYRQEDWVFARIVEDGGFRHGKVEDTFHWHQVMPRLHGGGGRVRNFKQVAIDVEMTPEEGRYTADTQVRGTIKYLKPDPHHVRGALGNLEYLHKSGVIDFKEFYRWVARTNPEWLAFLPLPAFVKTAVRSPKEKAHELGSGGDPGDAAPIGKSFIEAVVRYMDPGQCHELIPELNGDIARLIARGEWDGPGFVTWMAQTNPAWSSYFAAEDQAFLVNGPRGAVRGKSPVSETSSARSGSSSFRSMVDVTNRAGQIARILMARGCRSTARVFERLAARLSS